MHNSDIEIMEESENKESLRFTRKFDTIATTVVAITVVAIILAIHVLN